MANSKINVLEDDEDVIGYSAIARLIELGRQKSYVTYDDILHFFPDAEQDLGQLEEAFATLMSAGIPYIEDDESIPEPTEEDLLKDEDREPADEEDDIDVDIDDLRHIDTDDTIDRKSVV